MKRKIIVLLSLVIFCCFFECCKSGSEAPEAETRGAEFKKPIIEDRTGLAEDLAVTKDEISAALEALGQGSVGLIPCTMANEYHFAAADSCRSTLEGFGINVRLVDPETRSEKQISAIENLSAAGVKVIVICVLDPRVVESALKEAADKGIYIVQYAGRESAVNGIGISIDDAELGAAAGRYAADIINNEFDGNAAVAILDYPDLPNALLRADAIEKALRDKAPSADITGRYMGGTQEKGLNSIEAALQSRPDINVVVSINDAGAFGAYMAMEAAGVNPEKAAIVGIDAEKKALDLIAADGMYRATIDTQPARTGELAAQGAVKILAGSRVPRGIKVPIKVITREDLN